MDINGILVDINTIYRYIYMDCYTLRTGESPFSIGTASNFLWFIFNSYVKFYWKVTSKKRKVFHQQRISDFTSEIGN